ncbi:MAG: peptide MFS transporter [Bacteroidia bacterium]|nr:peptide MFS transporter [Bacteroidia bacterium]
MFKGQPKALFVLALANMGERFGYYTMLSIFALYLQAKFGFTPTKTSLIYSSFLAGVYFMPLIGGLLADRLLGYGRTVFIGTIIMFFGYLLLAAPVADISTGFWLMIGALALIALGTGLFKGNLQTLVGNLYDDAKYAVKRDLAFSIFYMFINIGAFFAPNAAEVVSNYVLAADNLKYEAKVPDLALKYLNYKVVDSTEFSNHIMQAAKTEGDEVKDYPKYLSDKKKKECVLYLHEQAKIAAELDAIGKDQLKDKFTDTESFARTFIGSLSKSYKWGFAVACISLIISILIYLGFRGTYKHADFSEKQKKKDKTKQAEVIVITKEQTRERIIALLLVFFVVIFFWMSFHQNGLTMTFFARDYTDLKIGPGMYLLFSLKSLIPIIIGFYGLMTILQNKEVRNRIIGGMILVASAVFLFFLYKGAPAETKETPPIFQQFNPFFIVILTPIFVAMFSWLNSKGKEPSAPRKIGYGMLIAAIGFMILIFASIGQKAPSEIVGGSDHLVSPNWLISTYLVLTLAELFLSPMGISFVSKVAPPQHKGLMMGGWFAATAIGNYLVGIIGTLWDKLPLYLLWTVLVICCLLSALFLFSIMKRLEKTTTN